MRSKICTGQLSIIDEISPKMTVGGCGYCVCHGCMRWWQDRCPFGGCRDDYRATVNPYDAAHGGEIRKQWSDWNKPGEQAHWCRGGICYPAHICEHYVQYQKPEVQYCLNATVTKWADGTVICSLVDVIGCEECMRRWEERRENT